MENNRYEPTEVGVPQGGPISPTIFNIALNGIENKIMEVKGVFPIRFADDIIILSDTIDKLGQTKEVIIDFLKPLGLSLNEDKTTIRSIEEGVDFLGYNFREYPDPMRQKRYKLDVTKATKKGILLVKPAIKSVENFKTKIRYVFKKYKQAKAYSLIMALNPVIRG